MSKIEDMQPVDALASRIWTGTRYDYPHIETMRRELKELRSLLAAKDAEIERLKARLAADHRFREAPCPICDYNGPGYFQPDQHPCAAMYHAAQRAKLHVTNQKEAAAAALKESPNA